MNDQTGSRRLRDILHIAPDGRQVHHWVGKDRDRDIAAFTKAIAGIGELFNHEGTLVQLGPAGELIPTKLAYLQEFIDKHICGMRIVKDGEVWRRDYFTWSFDPVPRTAEGTMATMMAGTSRRTVGPDQAALMQIYSKDLLPLIPKVEAG